MWCTSELWTILEEESFTEPIEPRSVTIKQYCRIKSNAKCDPVWDRGVPIIGSAIVSATNMVIFTNIGIGTEQQEDRYRYRYLYTSNSLYINGLCIVLHYSCGSLVPVAYYSL